MIKNGLLNWQIIYKMNKEERKIEGYWYSKYEPDYPMPEPNVLTEDEAKEIYDLITDIENDKGVKNTQYRGWSTSRITEERLGSTEFSTNEWTWPCDFAKHYVLEHRVKPTDEFLNYIGYKK